MARQVNVSDAPLDVDATGRWFWRLRKSAHRIARLADYRLHIRSPTYILERTLEIPDLVAALGGPRTAIADIVSGSRDALYTQWLHAGWGRRCGIYFDALSKGLLESMEVLEDESVRNLARRIGELSRMMNEFRPTRRPADTLRNALRRGHGITPFHVTYLDPALFSSLIALNRIEGEKPGSLGYSELGIEDADSREEVRHGLLKLIRDQVELYTKNGNGKSETLADDSALWWGVAELIDQKGGFKIGKYEHRTGAVELCCKLARWTLESPAEPTFGMALGEATPEIYHRGLRTKLFVIKNALRILRADWSSSQRERLRNPLTKLVTVRLDQVRRYPPDGERRAGEEEEHAYFTGLGLETASQCLMYVESLGFKVELSEMEASKSGDEREWTDWAPSSKHAKALGYKDYRTFEKQAKRWGWKRHPKNRQLSKFRISMAPAKRRKQYHENFE